MPWSVLCKDLDFGGVQRLRLVCPEVMERRLKEMERRRTLKSMLIYAPSLTPRAQDVFWPVTPGACQEVEVAGFASHGPGERECGV